MLNSVILIGRLVATPTLKVYENELSVTSIVLAVDRPFKNHEGEFDTDFIKCVFWDITAKNVTEYCKKGDCIAVRGRLHSAQRDISFDTENETLKKKIIELEVVGERVIFLSQPSYKKSYDKASEELDS